MSASRFCTGIFLAAIVLLGAGCASGPPTRYYDLRAPELEVLSSATLVPPFSLGLARVELPATYDHPGIVTLEAGNRVQRASYHIWAGDLDDAIDRLLQVNLGRLSGQTRIWVSPWDNRFRPDFQVRVVIHELAGVLDQKVRLNASWTLVADQGKRLVGAWQFAGEAENRAGDYNGYVGAINRLITDFSVEIARQVLAEAGRG